MKKKFLLTISAAALVFSYIKKRNNTPLIGDKAPAFKANSTKGVIDFPKDYLGKWVILFSHPADFTPVCTTEFMTFQNMYYEFREINTELIGLSTDSLSSHIAWLKNIKDKIEYKGLCDLDIDFPLIDDKCLKVSRKYGMIHPNASDTKTVRSVFIIDPKGIIRAILYYPHTTGRNTNEIKRLLIALQSNDEFDAVTPANWRVGEDVIVPPPANSTDAKKYSENDKNLKCLDWFLCFKKLPREVIEEKLTIK